MLIEKEFVIKESEYYETVPEDALCFDIETEGLNKQYSRITVIGTGYVRDKKIIFRQWFLDYETSEEKILKEFSDYLKSFSSIIQFNGNSFDIPYTLNRCRLYGLPDPFEEMGVIDIYRCARSLLGVTELENLKQKTLEGLFNINRRDRISGRDCIYAYRDYIIHNDLSALDALLLHNEEDVLGLLKIYSISALEGIEHSAELEEVNIQEDISLSFKLKTPIPFKLSRSDEEYSVYAHREHLNLTLHPLFCTRKLFFEDYKNYYYLPQEDRAIHKSVAIYTDSAYRKKATKATCYERLDGCFFRQYAEDIRPVFKSDAKDKGFWFRAEDMKKASEESLRSLCRNYLKYLFRT